MILQYNVTGQTLRPAGIMPAVVSDSVDFIHLRFSLDSWWQNMIVVAQFTQGEQVFHQVLDETGACLLPGELLTGEVAIMLFGQKSDEATRATTNSLYLYISSSGFHGDGESSIPPTADLYSQLIDIFTATIQGEPGQDGVDGVNGVDGMDGQDGADGASAYEIAVENGFTGTESEWLLSLKGADGVDGQDGTDGTTGAQGEKGDTGEQGIQGEKGDTGEQGIQGEKGDTGDTGAVGATGTTGAAGAQGTAGIDGQDGADGASAYEVAVANGFSGSESEWLLSLKGADGADGQDGQDGADGADFPYTSITQTAYEALTSYEDKLYVIVED